MTSPSTVCQSSEGDVKETVPLQEETPVQAKIMHTISNISDGDSLTVSKTPNCLIESKPLRDKTKENNKASLVSIPLEIRHQIYGLLLVSQDDLPARLPLRNDRERRTQRKWRKYQYNTSMGNILQTCKQIYHEARWVLYSQNVFRFYDPRQTLDFIHLIGLENLKLVKRLDFGVWSIIDRPPILPLFNLLAEEADGLQGFHIRWAFTREYSGLLRGLNAKLDARALEELRKILAPVIPDWKIGVYPFARITCSGSEAPIRDSRGVFKAASPKTWSNSSRYIYGADQN
jgi:hypothetical protein